MRFKVTEKNKITQLSPEGRLDALEADGFSREAEKVLKSKPEKLLLDLSELEYVSSAGLRAFLNLVKKADALKIPLAFHSLSPLVAEIFEVAGFNSILKVFSDRETALKN
ncbi:MAG: STAS domain-containing protein [Deltaproteobacteria bacterium]|jgi:anti-anti-sigma factor|nr:STAS domain-containing protein [Deltaproteobacteria bacterium]